MDTSQFFVLTLNGLVSFFFGVLGGVVSHVLIREYDRRVNAAERRELLRRRILLPPRRFVDEAWRKLLPPVILILGAAIVGIVTGSLWATIGVATVMGFVVGRIVL